VESYETEAGERSFRYPDTGRWDPERNVREFIAALPEWRQHGIGAVTVNFQGGRPIRGAWQGEKRSHQPHHNSAFAPDGSLKGDYTKRMRRALEALDAHGMVAIVGYFYFGQAWRLRDERAVLRATDAATEWLLQTGHGSLLVEVANETAQWYTHPMLRPARIHELVRRVKGITLDGRSLAASASLPGGAMPTDELTAACDFLLPHGNGQSPQDHRSLVNRIRDREPYRRDPKPIIFNEANTDVECLDAAWQSGASWGYHDGGANDYDHGFQSPPVNWSLNTPQKRAFARRVAEVTGLL
jgi:hypothetical protein